VSFCEQTPRQNIDFDFSAIRNDSNYFALSMTLHAVPSLSLDAADLIDMVTPASAPAAVPVDDDNTPGTAFRLPLPTNKPQ
jgi:hypothetical protein